MLLFRRLLVLVRKQYIYNRKQFLLVAVGSTVVLGLISAGLDFILPWATWGMLLRTIVLVPTAVAIFLLGYSASLAYHFAKVKDPAWTPLRQRYSPTWRQRISMIIGAVLLVLVYAIAMKPGYTFASSAIVAIIIGLFVFMRKSSTEITREELGIPDARDAALNTHLRRYANENRIPENKEKAKSDNKAKARVDKARAQLAKAEAELEGPDTTKK